VVEKPAMQENPAIKVDHADGPISNPREGARLLVSLATYNEAGNLRDLVVEIRKYAPHCDILIVDDNSPDGTGRIADELKSRLPSIQVIHRPGKQGLGTAILTAMNHAVAHGYDLYINLDADFSHPPRYIPDLLAGMADHDVMIGSRYVPGGGVENEFTFGRKLMSGAINWYARLLLGLTTRDNSGSYRCYRVEKLAEIDFRRVRSRGYAFMEEILYRCRQVDCRIAETPILFANRRAGASKINSAEVVYALQILPRLGLERIARFFKRSGVPQPHVQPRRVHFTRSRSSRPMHGATPSPGNQTRSHP